MRIWNTLAALLSLAILGFGGNALAQSINTNGVDLQGCDTNLNTSDLGRHYACSDGGYLALVREGSGFRLVRYPAPAPAAPRQAPVTSVASAGAPEPRPSPSVQPQAQPQAPVQNALVTPPPAVALAQGQVWRCYWRMVPGFGREVQACTVARPGPGGTFVAQVGWWAYYNQDGSPAVLPGQGGQPQTQAQVQPLPVSTPPVPATPPLTFEQQQAQARWNASPNTNRQNAGGEGPPISTRITDEPTQSGGRQVTVQQAQPSVFQQVLASGTILGMIYLATRNNHYW